MVAAGVMMLVDEERLKLDDPVTQYIPELRFHDPLLTREATIRDLLSHRTGLPRTDLWAFMQQMPLDEQIDRLAAVESAAPLRSRHIYQNTMYELVGLVIERITGQRWDHFLGARLWQPLGMHETFGARGQIPPEMAHVLPHDVLNGEPTVIPWDLPPALADAAGSVWTSLRDMGLWAQFLLRDGVAADGARLLSEAAFAELFKPQGLIDRADFYPTAQLTDPNWLSYGLGWFQQDFQGRMIDFHTGSLSGLVALIGLDRAADRAVIVFGNRDHAELRHAILWEVMDNRLSEQRRDWNDEIFELYRARADEADAEWQKTLKKRLQGTRPGLSPEAYRGRYESPAGGALTVAGEGRRLTLQTPVGDLPLQHWHLDTFLLESPPRQLREFAGFGVGPDARVTELKIFGHVYERVGEDVR
jgi:CubicO group peptidase (beta-lactamase class C family)